MSNHNRDMKQHARRSRHGRPLVVLLALVLPSFAASQGWTETTPGITRDAHVERHTSHGPVDVTTRIDRTTAQIADKIAFTIKLKAPAGVHLSFPKIDDQLGDFDVVNTKSFDDLPAADGTDNREWIRSYELESLVSGELEVPSITLPYSDSRTDDGTTGTIETEPIPVTILSLLEGQSDPSKYRDIKGIVQVEPPPTSQVHPAVVVAVGTLLLACSVGALFFARRLNRATSTRDWALAQLDSLATELGRGEYDADSFFTQLTDIIRNYVEQQFSIAAPRQTTDEFFTQLTESSVVAEHRSLLKSFLATADLVKFAGLSPDAENGCAAILQARDFVERSSRTLKVEAKGSFADSSAKTSAEAA